MISIREAQHKKQESLRAIQYDNVFTLRQHFPLQFFVL